MFINYLKYTQLKKTCHITTAGLLLASSILMQISIQHNLDA